MYNNFNNSVAGKATLEQFSHGVARKAFWGLTYKRMWATVARFIGAKTKDCPQVPVLTHDQEVQLPLPAEVPPLGLRQHLHLSDQEGQDPEMQNFALSHFPIWTSIAKAWWRPGRDWHCAWARMAATKGAHKETISWPLIPLIIFLGFGREKTFF